MVPINWTGADQPQKKNLKDDTVTGETITAHSMFRLAN